MAKPHLLAFLNPEALADFVWPSACFAALHYDADRLHALKLRLRQWLARSLSWRHIRQAFMFELWRRCLRRRHLAHSAFRARDAGQNGNLADGDNLVRMTLE